MKEYEVYSSLKVPKNSKIIVRLDGRSFHNLAKDLNLVKPYDENFIIESIKKQIGIKTICEGTINQNQGQYILL